MAGHFQPCDRCCGTGCVKVRAKKGCGA
jgi:hypothetical protein